MYGSAYFVIDPNLSANENQKEIQARLRDLHHILTNRAVAIFYLNMQNNYDFGAFSDIEKNLYDISRRDYWFILQEPEWKLVLSSLQSVHLSGNPYMNSHVIKNEINSKLNDYGRENRNDRTRRVNWNTPERIDYKSELLRTYSLNEYIQREHTTDESTAINDAVLVDESSLDSHDEVEVLDNFKQLYLSLDTLIEKKVLYRSYFEQDAWTQTTLAIDLHISPTKLKRIKAKIEKKALDLGMKWYI